MKDFNKYYIDLYEKKEAKDLKLLAEIYNLHVNQFEEFEFKAQHIVISNRESFALNSRISGRQIGDAEAIVTADGVIFNFSYLSDDVMKFHSIHVVCPVYAFDPKSEKKVYMNKWRYEVHEKPGFKPKGHIGGVMVKESFDQPHAFNQNVKEQNTNKNTEKSAMKKEIEFDAYGRPLKYDDKGQPIYEDPEYDEYGDPIYYDPDTGRRLGAEDDDREEEEVVARDENGDVIYDEFGDPVMIKSSKKTHQSYAQGNAESAENYEPESEYEKSKLETAKKRSERAYEVPEPSYLEELSEEGALEDDYEDYEDVEGEYDGDVYDDPDYEDYV